MFNPEQKIAVKTLYLNKLQTSLVYDVGARRLKSYSEGIYRILSAFSSQDYAHAIQVHGIMDELETMVTDRDNVAGLVSVAVVPLGKVAERKQDEEDKDLFFQSTREWSTSLSNYEKRTLAILASIQNKEQEFVEFFNDHIWLGGLMSVSEDRMRVLSDLESRADRIFADGRDRTAWRCTYCGYIETGAEAPEECPCCRQATSFFERGNWRIMA